MTQGRTQTSRKQPATPPTTSHDHYTLAQTPTDILTPREAAVLDLIMHGQTNREAGKTLGISSRTVEFHRANVMQKFGARNIADLMRMVLRRQ